ncbi:hypothetical protein LPJGGPFB_00724 [Ensifer adhaerens]|uniref:Uncharacterized protein n=1 Tax=Ensifer adhaerens TaxID=106592 RepID=A0ACC5SQQ9_ENSAD|nr:hypothetical protein [Ensifer adhaerens]MBP1871130.1 hypothetical protein [Ensifer adhaerens]NRP17503.1 hypothetical protein [Ensifer adhaerens]
MYPIDGFRGRPILPREFPMVADVFRDAVQVRYSALDHEEGEAILAGLMDLHRTVIKTWLPSVQ